MRCYRIHVTTTTERVHGAAMRCSVACLRRVDHDVRPGQRPRANPGRRIAVRSDSDRALHEVRRVRRRQDLAGRRVHRGAHRQVRAIDDRCSPISRPRRSSAASARPRTARSTSIDWISPTRLVYIDRTAPAHGNVPADADRRNLRDQSRRQRQPAAVRLSRWAKLDRYAHQEARGQLRDGRSC